MPTGDYEREDFDDFEDEFDDLREALEGLEDSDQLQFIADTLKRISAARGMSIEGLIELVKLAR